MNRQPDTVAEYDALFVFVIFVSFDLWFGIFVYFETVRPVFDDA